MHRDESRLYADRSCLLDGYMPTLVKAKKKGMHACTAARAAVLFILISISPVTSVYYHAWHKEQMVTLYDMTAVTLYSVTNRAMAIWCQLPPPSTRATVVEWTSACLTVSHYYCCRHIIFILCWASCAAPALVG